MKAKSFLPTTIVIFTFLAQATFAAPPRYEIIDLGTLGGDQSSASFVNDRGQIVGMAYNQQGNHRATLFDSTGNGNNIDLGTLGGVNSWACSVNYIGQIMGSADNEQSNLRATLFDPNGSGKNIDLGTLGNLLSNALSINNRGQIVGYARNEQGYQRATLFDPTGGGKNIDLGTLGGIHSQAWYVNDRGQIVGKARIPRGYSHATLFDPTGGGNNIDLGTLGGSSSNACSINNLGQIVGWAATDWLDNRATLFDPNGGGKNIELGTLGGRLSWAEAINDLGQIVGAAEDQLRYDRATLFDPTGNGNNIDLNTLIDPACGWTLKYTDSISNHGWIVGTGINPAGQSRAFLMKPLPRTIYVDDDATGANDGSSWADAFNYLQDALTAAWSGDEIRVAQGIYKPDQGVGQTPGDREATFQLINGVKIKGGYAGTGAPDHNARDIELYETILSGDLAGNDRDVNDPQDLLDEPTRVENSRHVVTSRGTNVTAILDGFIITGGRADGLYPNGAGGGMYSSGGGTYTYRDGTPMLINCTFSRNSAAWGGGMENHNSNPTLINCTFSNNAAVNGGGMRNGNDRPILINCTFSGNCASTGGGISGGGTLTNCTFTGNCASWYGGAGIWGDDDVGTLTLANCILWGNRDWYGSMSESAQINMYYSPVVNYTCIQGWTGLLSGTGNIGDDPHFVELGYWNDNGTPADPSDDFWIEGDYHLLPDSPCIDTGDPNYIAGPNETDLDGRPRVIGGRIDMGAYETPVFAEARILPRTINLASKGKWITSYIWLPDDYNVADVEPNSILLEGEIESDTVEVDVERQVIIAKFSREDIQSILEVGNIKLTITCQLTDGTYFEASDIIKVVDKAGLK